MISRVHLPVRAARDIRTKQHQQIKAGTPGEVISVTGVTPAYYCVMFWPSGLGGGTVTVNYLHRTDLKEA